MKQAAFMEKEAKYMRKIKKLEKKMKLRYIHELKKLCGEQVKEENNSKAIISKRPRSTFTGENLRKRRKMVPKRPVRTQVVINEVTEQLKEFIVNEIKGTELTLVIQKNMFKSDTDKGLNRLNMPIKQLESDEFLREDERRILSKTRSIYYIKRAIDSNGGIYSTIDSDITEGMGRKTTSSGVVADIIAEESQPPATIA
ncbi:hypothetical protein QVD17_20909 [Tagetes erecta]|uniref:Uncharacterized protein n=1 Tax=Tagetes erecta TaxID=13708 RepID=A0AAD8KM21_TARER|nr:hypothetical protein QVD17_20909 [Tagetes erecta]